MTISMIANACVWNAVVFPSAMKCVLKEGSLFSPAAATFWQTQRRHVDGSYDIFIFNV
jgi:hypothetical protein